MGFVRIETITENRNRAVFEIESNGLYKINCLPGKLIKSLDKIYEMSIFRNMLVIITEDRDLRNGFQVIPTIKEDRSDNNILAYDLQGNFLWNIGDIVGDIKLSFSGFSCIFKEDAEKIYGVAIPNDLEILIDCVAEGFTFLIDPINRKLLYRLSGYVR